MVRSTHNELIRHAALQMFAAHGGIDATKLDEAYARLAELLGLGKEDPAGDALRILSGDLVPPVRRICEEEVAA